MCTLTKHLYLTSGFQSHTFAPMLRGPLVSCPHAGSAEALSQHQEERALVPSCGGLLAGSSASWFVWPHAVWEMGQKRGRGWNRSNPRSNVNFLCRDSRSPLCRIGPGTANQCQSLHFQVRGAPGSRRRAPERGLSEPGSSARGAHLSHRLPGSLLFLVTGVSVLSASQCFSV